MGSLFSPGRSAEEKRKEAQLLEEERKLKEEKESAKASLRSFATLTQTSPTGAGKPSVIKSTLGVS